MLKKGENDENDENGEDDENVEDDLRNPVSRRWVVCMEIAQPVVVTLPRIIGVNNLHGQRRQYTRLMR